MLGGVVMLCAHGPLTWARTNGIIDDKTPDSNLKTAHIPAVTHRRVITYDRRISGCLRLGRGCTLGTPSELQVPGLRNSFALRARRK
ncbi:uncharacterized protein BDV14DRAFT_168984 [Aspergillus stella-maris]|uniref:uncharacterized protein n=1 Tax=Aspergillus stella-maris TaxID=1810926 RepID=UPI003CCD030A